jgi:CRP-like cAMP-binding protein
MNSKQKLPFDPKVFLAKVNGGRTISDYRNGQIEYTQGDPADSVFYIQKGKVKITVLSELGKEAEGRRVHAKNSIHRRTAHTDEVIE